MELLNACLARGRARGITCYLSTPKPATNNGGEQRNPTLGCTWEGAVGARGRSGRGALGISFVICLLRGGSLPVHIYICTSGVYIYPVDRAQELQPGTVHACMRVDACTAVCGAHQQHSWALRMLESCWQRSREPRRVTSSQWRSSISFHLHTYIATFAECVRGVHSARGLGRTLRRHSLSLAAMGSDRRAGGSWQRCGSPGYVARHVSVLFCFVSKKIGLAPYWHGGSTALVSAAHVPASSFVRRGGARPHPSRCRCRRSRVAGQNLHAYKVATLVTNRECSAMKGG